MKRFLIIFLAITTIAPAVEAARLYKEAYYQNIWCEAHKGKLEYELEDYTRIDCLTDKYAVEFDFANKWAEGVGQSLYYGLRTGKKPTLVLILEKSSDYRFYKRAKALADKYGIELFTMKSPVFE